jgi:hypothetical protein
VPQSWQQTSEEMRRQIMDRVNAALKYEKIAEAPEEVIDWRMKTLLDRQCRVSQFNLYSLRRTC